MISEDNRCCLLTGVGHIPLESLLNLSSLKMECEKLASEKTEMQRHYVMVSIIFCHVMDKSILINWL